MPHVLDLRIAGLCVRLDTELALPEEERFRPFVCEGLAPDCTAVFRRTECLPALSPAVLYEDNCFRVHPDGRGGYVRAFFDPPRSMEPYAVVTADYRAGAVRIDYLDRGTDCLCEIGNSFYHVGFEALLCCHSRLCLHAACVRTELGGLLFSGVSGIGKSTQARLWERFRGAKQINGDRPVLSRGGAGGFLAWGSPYAGSSRVYVNESVPVSAILMLRQAGECSLRRMGEAEAFRRVFAGLTAWSWDAAFVGAVCDLAQELTGCVPVYEFACTPDEAAVDFLEAELGERL